MTGRTVNINLMQIISLYDKFNFHFFAGCCFGGRVLAAITLAAECVILAPVLPIFFGNNCSCNGNRDDGNERGGVAIASRVAHDGARRLAFW